MQTKEAAKRDEESKNRNILTAKWEQPAQARDMSRSWRLRSKMDKKRLGPVWRLTAGVVFWRLVLASIYEAVHMAIIHMLHVYCSVSYDNCHASACWSLKERARMKESASYVWDDTLPHYYNYYCITVHHSLFCICFCSNFILSISMMVLITIFVYYKNKSINKFNKA